MSASSSEVAAAPPSDGSSAPLTKPPPPPRLPSLNQLAARMSVSSPSKENATTSPSSSRPRLAAFAALRTNSSTTVSSVDSMAVNAPTTRAASPLSTSSPSGDTTSTPTEERPEGEGDPLTAEKLQTLENATATGEKKPYPKGYKNIPSLDAITARMTMAKSRTLSIDGSARPPEPELIDDPKTPGIQMKPAEHPLEHTWTVYHDSKTPKFASQPPSSASDAVPFPGTPSAAPPTPFSAESKVEYEAGLTIVGTFDTVETFCRYLNWLKPPSKLEKNSNYHLFKAGIKPMWEDPANANGGKWVITMKNNPMLLDRCWNWLAMALVGDQLEEGSGDDICGAVVSLRRNLDRIQVWTRDKDNVERLNAIGKKIVALLDVSEKDGVNLEFQYNSEDKPMPNKFLSIQSVPITGSYRSSFHPSNSDGSMTPNLNSPHNSPGPGGAFGSFGVGIGGGSQWRGGKRG